MSAALLEVSRLEAGYGPVQVLRGIDFTVGDGEIVVILGATHTRAPVGFAPLAIGLALTLIHLISIPVTNTSVNPARSTGVGVFAGSVAISQLWLFWIAPIAGGLLGGVIYRWLGHEGPDVTGVPKR